MEMDRLVRQRTAENIVNAVSTLKSLAQLVSEIPNMVVLDQIQTEVSRNVTQALDSLRLSCDTLQAGDYASSLAHSILAIERAERAFFDPTMVSMLYFPDEHKYAIYMPLFVPISVPLFMALWKEAREARQRRKAGKAKNLGLCDLTKIELHM
ncbi:phosphatidylinositol-glycan biosynthesis class S protein [Jimgerdemannia flammicorona]|uniref:Phosphatidylinositol-glycan biosynthesis class S protein n=1 Tax=Jimgerdemannia flammicorona TaxID=994334 RepID=A0A433QZT8_9FUNG|nr:phosphatidylinositol-glycan biosynthesis class S protein [Jimgerdemannia flammicorona]